MNMLWLRLCLAVLPPAVLLLINKRNKRKENDHNKIEGELEPNQQDTSASTDDVGPSDQHREPCLEPKHKIFLSHSGSQDFTEQLCEDLERVHHIPFFDKSLDSLPKG